MSLIIIGSIFTVLITVCVLFFWRSTKYSFDGSETRKMLYILSGVIIFLFSVIVLVGWFMCLNSYLSCIYKGDKQNPQWGFYSGCVEAVNKELEKNTHSV